MNTENQGFTVIELIFVVVLVLAASILFFIQKNNLEVAARDNERKTAINAIYYSLEEVYFKEHGAYPRTVDADTLPSVDPELFKDPFDVKIGEADSDYRYEPTDCEDDECQSYTLRTFLENEDDFVKENRDN